MRVELKDSGEAWVICIVRPNGRTVHQLVEYVYNGEQDRIDKFILAKKTAETLRRQPA